MSAARKAGLPKRHRRLGGIQGRIRGLLGQRRAPAGLLGQGQQQALKERAPGAQTALEQIGRLPPQGERVDQRRADQKIAQP